MLCCHGGDNIEMGGAGMDDLTVRMMEGYDSDDEWLITCIPCLWERKTIKYPRTAKMCPECCRTNAIRRSTSEED